MDRGAPKTGKNLRTVWRIRTSNLKGVSHAATYSVALCKTPILAGCPEEGIVLDPFIGTGTTAVAAIQLGRKYCGIELNPEFVKTANERIKKIKEYYGL